MKEFVSMDVIQSGQDLEQDALDARAVEGFVIPRLHELIEVSVHVLHTNVEFLGEWVKKDVQRRHEMGMSRKGSQKNHFTKLQAGRKRLEGFFHGLDRYLRSF